MVGPQVVLFAPTSCDKLQRLQIAYLPFGLPSFCPKRTSEMQKTRPKGTCSGIFLMASRPCSLIQLEPKLQKVGSVLSFPLAVWGFGAVGSTLPENRRKEQAKPRDKGKVLLQECGSSCSGYEGSSLPRDSVFRATVDPSVSTPDPFLAKMKRARAQ